MGDGSKHYVGGAWVDALEPKSIEVVNPATEEPFASVILGGPKDVDRAVEAARDAFPSFSSTTKAERIAMLGRIVDAYESRADDMAETISREMGAPITLAKDAQAPMGLLQLRNTLDVLEAFEPCRQRGSSILLKEPIGVCGFITPWNWPMNQILCKVAPALGVGCTMVLKPSERTPLSALILAEAIHAAGVPPGVFNLVNGEGSAVGGPLSSHPDVDMVSITGSTRAGVAVARAAAPTVKRVTQELGGKSANIILPDADHETAVTHGVEKCFLNAGQSCTSPSRMFVHEPHHDDATRIAARIASSLQPGDPSRPDTVMGPVANQAQFERVQALIQTGIDEGATLVVGGVGRPAGHQRGYFVKPTVFGQVRNDMTIAREEIFGPVLSILPYATEDDAVAMANDSDYGLSGCVYSGNIEHAIAVASKLRTGQVHLNGAGADFTAPFGGYKRSGNGREWGPEGLEEFLEIKALMGVSA
jgi:aldehyde dehydrogenase (NAD+)